MKDRFVELVKSGLYGDNLHELSRICDESLPTNPVCYHTLRGIFRALLAEYDEQGIPENRYSITNEKLKQPLIDCIENENRSPEIFLKYLSAVIMAFESIS